MELDYYNAAMEGNINAFEGKGGEEIESILTPNKNTILHIHFTNYTQSVSDTFVGKVLGMCPALLLKTNVKDETILHIAARYGHHKIVRKLIDYAKDLSRDIDGVGVEKRLIRALNDKKDTALHEAARYDYPEVVEVLIKEELDHSYFGKNDGGETPLYIAVERRYWNVVDTILDNSDSPQYNGPNGRNALHAAIIFCGREYLSKFWWRRNSLLAKQADEEKVSKLLTRNSLLAKQADENGWVPLHLAVIVGYSEIVELLSKDRSTAYMRDNKGRTALHLAALHGNVSAMKIILKCCPDCCELVDEKGCNAFHYTTMDESSSGSHISFKMEILKKVPLMRNLCNEKDDDGNTPLHYFTRLFPKYCDYEYNHYNLVPTSRKEVDMMAFNKYGQNPLDVAVADMTQHSASMNKLYEELVDEGAMFGGRVLDKRLREKKQEKRHDPTIDENDEKGNKRNRENGLYGTAASYLSVVAILIATVTFTAGFTLPGGLIQDKGSPILKYNAAFIAFVITDSLSFVLSTSVVLLIFFSILGRKVARERDEPLGVVTQMLLMHFTRGLLYKCFMLTIVAMGFMIIAFGTGLYAVLGVTKGFGVVTLLIVLSFFFIFIILIMRIEKVQKFNEAEWKNDRRLKECSHFYSLLRVRDIQLSDIV